MILVTGATGNVGREVVRLLAAQGAPLRAAVTDVGRARGKLGEAALVTFDFRRLETFRDAFAGVERVFLLRPPAISNATAFKPALAAARAAGVQQLVFLSLLGAERNPVVPHHAIERLIVQTGVPHTFLRPSFFMQNLDTTHRTDIRDRNEIFLPAGTGRTSFIDVRDVAAVAVKTLTEPEHIGAAYPLTGTEALTYAEVAQALARATGRAIQYRAAPLPAFIVRYRAYGYPLSYILVMCGIYTSCRLGLAGAITPDAARLLGRAPLMVAQYTRDYREAWM